jgi:CHAT domain-containing protein/tetratricopeptide (TPR) repeat protein
MSNEPRAGMGIDPEMLAAYIDQRLSPEQRAAVEAQLAKDPDSYAVLVETLKALDDESIKALDVQEERGHDPLPFPSPAPRSSVTRRIVTGVLALAASIALVVWTLPGLLRDQTDPEVAALVAAAGSSRVTEARLSGGFAHAPFAGKTRGDEIASRNLTLLAAAGELQKKVESNPTPHVLHAWGVAQLLIGQVDSAARTLETALASQPNDAGAYSDAAAAQLALSEGQRDRLMRALEYASRAVELDPGLAVASFNRALVLEQLALFDQALEEWTRYLSIETDPAWREEGQARIQSLEQQLSKRPQAAVPSTLRELGGLDAEAIDRLVVETPFEMRTALDGPMLSEAMDLAARGGMRSDAETALRIASRLRLHTGDTLSESTWQHALSSPVPGVIRAGIDAYLEGRALLLKNDVTEAQQRFRAADQHLRRAGSPASEWSTFFLAHCAFYLGRTNDAERLLTSRISGLVESGRLAVAARSSYLLGLVRLRLGQHAAVVSAERQSADLARRVGDIVTEVGARSEVADAFERLSLLQLSWQERSDVLRLSEPLPNRALRHIATVAASRSAINEGYLHAAQAFATATLVNADSWNNAGAKAEARIRLADIAQRRGDPDRALDLLSEADGYLAGMPDSAFADGWRADLEMARGMALLARSPEQALAAGSRVFEIASRRESPYRLARARYLKGRSLMAADPVAAREEFRAGLRAAEVLPTAPDPFGRSMAEQRWDLLKELLALQGTAATPDESLDEVLAVMIGGRPAPTLSSLQKSLADGDAVLVAIALQDGVLAWSVTSAEVRRSVTPVPRDRLVQLITAYTAALEDPGTLGWLDASRALSQFLLPPIRDIRPRRLLLATDALLSTVPFASLADGSELLSDTTSIEMLAWNDGRALADQRAAGGRVLVVGDPDHRAMREALPSLAAARDEAVHVAALYRNARLLIGGDATRTAFLEALGTAAIVHFAGHALGNRIDPAASRLLLAGDDGESEVTAGEIARLTLGARIAVLGACETAVGAPAAMSPVYGLARAFLQAGVHHVVAAQWKVSDNASREFLLELHRQLARGAALSEALNEAQRSLRLDARYKHPFYWSGFGVYSARVAANGESQ